MVLFRLHDFDANFPKNIGEHNINNYDVYSDIRYDEVGSIKDILVDEAGSLRYLVIDTAFWVQGKHVLLPIGRCRTDDKNRRVYAKGLTREQVFLIMLENTVRQSEPKFIKFIGKSLLLVA